MHDHSLTNIRPVCTLKFIPNDSNRETLNKRVNDLHDNLRKRITNGRSFLKGKGVGRGGGAGREGHIWQTKNLANTHNTYTELLIFKTGLVPSLYHENILFIKYLKILF